MPRRLLVTSALPYANGHIHLGHLVEYLQTDMWVRFQKLRGHECRYFCADDTHGTAITIRARKEGRPEHDVIAEMSASHQADFQGFGIEFDCYSSTNSEHNRAVCHEVWAALRGKGLVSHEDIQQLFDPEAGTFLADRFVKGTCPKCGAEDQYGDSCEKCGATYSPIELIQPRSTLSGATPDVRSARHLFVEIDQLREFLTEWTQNSGALQTEVANYLKGHFLGEPLRKWDVSRPGPYFGFEIPDSPGDYWYVWFDAPIGYIGTTAAWCEQHGGHWADWWRNPEVEIHHFIGKDITYFHTLFWPAMLHSAGIQLPRKVHIHGFLTVNGEKMSKSRGTFLLASTYLKHLDPAALRYYYAAKLGSGLGDLDLNLDEFVAKVNSDVVGKVVNLASRSAKFVEAVGFSPTYPDDGGLFAAAASQADVIAEAYETCDFAAAMRAIMVLADQANKYVDEQQPWTLKKDPAQAARLQNVCTVTLNLFWQLTIYLAPVLPQLAQQASRLLQQPLLHWDDVRTPLVGRAISRFEHMMKRVDPAQVKLMVDESLPMAPEAIPGTNTAAPAPAWNDGPETLALEPLVAEHCSIDDFTKIDLRVARVIEARPVEGADKLLQLTVSLGGDVRRNVFAGIKAAYKPEDLVGRLVIIVANLAPRKMRFGISEGMICAAGAGGAEVYVLNPDSGAKPGHRVH